MFGQEMRAQSGLSFAPLFQWVTVEMEENPAQPDKRSMLQFAAQSFTYTDNLNNSWSRKGGRGGGEHKIEIPSQKKWVSVSSFSRKVLLRVARCVTLHHSNTEIQSVVLITSSFDVRQKKPSPALTHTLSVCLDSHSCGKVLRIQKISTPDVEARSLRRR